MKGSLLLLLAATHAFHSAPSHRIPRAARARHHHHHRAATPKMLGLPEKPFEAGVAALIGLGILIKVAPFVVVPPGEVGVVTTLGKMNPDPLEPGLALRNPISRVQLFSTKTQLSEEQNFVPTKEGLTVELDTALLYRIDSASAPQLLQSVGERFADVIIKPEVRSIVRGLTSKSEAKALYTSGRDELQRELKAELADALKTRGIIVEDFLLKAIKLPDQLVRAIELKAQAEQEAQRMEFVLQKEQQEAERKKIEAQGIADFQKIVSDGISPNLLKWKGIEATEKLAKSPNSKIVIMGNSKDSLPVILGQDDGIGSNRAE